MKKIYWLSLSLLLATGAVQTAQTQTAQAQTGPGGAPSSSAQTREERIQGLIQDAIDLNRAKNLARMAAERANGGLSVYHADASMHGPSEESPYVKNADGSYTFSFTGGPPGHTTPTVESVVTVVPGPWDVNVDYNGPIR